MSATMPTLAPGSILFEQTVLPTGRERIALFSAATQDPNPIHVDDEFARRAGFPTVLQQGPMTTAHFAELLQRFVGVDALVSLDVSFTAPVFPDDTLILRAEVIDVAAKVRCRLSATKSDGTKTAHGEAEIDPRR
jgi:acyl dehydratase